METAVAIVHSDIVRAIDRVEVAPLVLLPFTKETKRPISKRKRVRPRVCEISPVSIYGEVYGGKDLRKRGVLSLE